MAEHVSLVREEGVSAMVKAAYETQAAELLATHLETVRLSLLGLSSELETVKGRLLATARLLIRSLLRGEGVAMPKNAAAPWWKSDSLTVEQGAPG